MTALAKDRDTRKKQGVLGEGPVAASTLLYGGAAICRNASGYLVPGADTAGLAFEGIAGGRFDNSAGANGALTAVFERTGLHLMILATAITIADIGKKVFLKDDQTVDLEANVANNIFCGVIAEMITTTMAYINIEPATAKKEVFNTPELLADPGNAGAIKAGQSGNCAITTTAAQTRTLAAPARTGLTLALSMAVDGGDCVITVASAINQTGNNTITMNDAGDTIVLHSVRKASANVWRVLVNDGCTLATV